MDDYTRRVRLRAYLIWERAGQPEGRDAEHWYQAEREVAQEEDAAGLRAGACVRQGCQGVRENPAESKERLKRRSRHLRARREMSSNGRRKLHGARAKVMMLPVDARLS